MKRSALRLVVASGLVSLALVAPSVAEEGRVVVKTYAGPGSAQAGEAEIHSYCMEVQETETGGACFRVRRVDRRAKVVITDESLENISGRIWLKGRKDIRFCGSTDGTFRIPSRQRYLAVVLEAGGCMGSGAVPTSGQITAIFKD